MTEFNHAQTFQSRIETIISLLGSPMGLARGAGLSRRVIDNYRTGQSDPSRERLIALAEAAGVTVEWLATGKGPMHRPSHAAPPGHETSPAAIDAELLSRVIDGVSSVVCEAGQALTSNHQAETTARLYAEIVAAVPRADRSAREGALAMALAHLRRDIRTTAPGPATPGPADPGTGSRDIPDPP
ncbi:MAG: helix-turn-helix domain-containing protein [Azospirillum sp.]|nr:helix-turn-helix domain-containing protein [Azospirillum sp.]